MGKEGSESTLKAHGEPGFWLSGQLHMIVVSTGRKRRKGAGTQSQSGIRTQSTGATGAIADVPVEAAGRLIVMNHQAFFPGKTVVDDMSQLHAINGK